MHRRALAMIGIVAFGTAVSGAAPAYADFGAIAYDQKTGRAGWSVNQPTPKRAAEVALSNCAAGDCKVVVRIEPRMCAALARAGKGKQVGIASRRDRDQARLAALSDCNKAKLGECVIRFSECNR